MGFRRSEGQIRQGQQHMPVRECVKMNPYTVNQPENSDYPIPQGFEKVYILLPTCPRMSQFNTEGVALVCGATTQK